MADAPIMWDRRTVAAYTARPVNAAEAARAPPAALPSISIRAPGLMAVPEEETNPIFPMTLDLRLPHPDKQTIIKKSSGLVP